MVRRLGLGLLWISFLVYSFTLAPPDDPQTNALIMRMISNDIEGLNPLVVAVFNIMGVLPLMYCAFVFVDGRGQKIWAFPFAIASFLLGAFALMPYLILRDPNPHFSGALPWYLKLLESRWFGIGLSVVALGLLGWGISQGDWSDFVQQWQTNRFIHVMSLDFCLLSSLFPTLLGDDMARRGLESRRVFWLVSLIPLFGPLAYLCVRPSLVPESTTAPA